MKKFGNRKGFTLLEILVVITLIIIIVGIALPRFTGVTDEGRQAKAAAELRTLQTALEAYLIKTSSALPAATAGTTADIETALEGAAPRLIGEVSDFLDPFSSSNARYLYKISSNSRYYVLHSVGADRAADITGIDTSGNITPTSPDDDVYVTNGQLSA